MSGVTWPTMKLFLDGLVLDHTPNLLEGLHPVARSTQADAIRAGTEGPDLGDENPCAWAPRIAIIPNISHGQTLPIWRWRPPGRGRHTRSGRRRATPLRHRPIRRLVVHASG